MIVSTDMLMRLMLASLVLLGVAHVASAQSADPVSSQPAAATSGVVATTIDLSRLPIDVQRIERRFREGEFREERNGLNLRYFVEVYGKAPNIVLFSKEDNLEHGPTPYGAPTHREMLDMMTPREFRNYGGVDLLSISRWLSGKADKK